MHSTFFGISGLVAGVSSASFGLFVLLKSPNRKIGIRWFLFTLAVSGWGFGGFWIGCYANTAEMGLLAWRAAYALGVLWIPVFFYDFVCHFLDLNRRSSIRWQYLIATAFLAIIPTHFFFRDTRYMFHSFYYVNGGLVYPLFCLWWAGLVIYSHWEMIRQWPRVSAVKQNQIKYFFVSTFIAFSTGGMAFAGAYGFDIYPWGYPGIIVNPLIMSYAIVGQRLMDIELLAREALARGGALFALAMPFVILSVVFRQIWVAPVIVVTGMLSIRLLYDIVFKKVQMWVDTHIFQGRFSGKRTLRAVAQQSFRLSNLSDLVNQSVENIATAFDLERAALYFHNMTVNKFTCVVCAPKSREAMRDFSEGDPLIISLHRMVESDPSVALELQGYAGVLPLQSDQNVFGFLLLGTEGNGKRHLSDETLNEIRQLHEHALWYAHAFYEQSMMLDKMTHDNIRYAGNIRRFVFGYTLNYASDMTDEQKEILVHIDGQAKMLEEYLNDLRQIMGILARRMQGLYKMEVYDAGELIREIMAGEQTHAHQQGIQLTSNLSGEESHSGQVRFLGWGERGSIRHVIENLLSNAFKFTPRGGTINLEIRDLGEDLQITISDTGPGIPPESVPHIFDLFYQGPGRANMAKSTGIGLSIVKEIVALHHGNIDVISDVGRGSSFFVRLPSGKKHQVQAA